MKRPVYFPAAALFIFLVGFLTRFISLDGVSLWYDEAVTRVIVRQDSLAEMYDLLLNDPTHLPLYFLIVQMIRPESDFVLRLPNVFIGLLSIALIMRIAISLYHDYPLALWVGGLLAINPYSIWLARTARPNALLLLVVLIVTYSFFQLLRGYRTPLHWLLYIVASMLAFTTHYYAAALPVAQYIIFAFTLRGNRKFFWQWVGANFIAVLPLMVWWYGLMTQDKIALGIGWIPEPTLQDPGLTFWNMTVGYEGETAGYELWGVLAAFIGVIVGLYYALRYWKRYLVDFYWFWLAIPPLLIIFGLSFLRPLYVDRYFMFALPSLLFLMVRGWQFLAGTPYRASAASYPYLKKLKAHYRVHPLNTFLPLIFVVVSLASFLDVYLNKDHEHQDWHGVVDYIEQHRWPNDALMIGNELMLIPFHAYFDGEIPVVLFEDTDISEMPDPPPDYVWLVYQDGRGDVHRQGEFPGFRYEHLPVGMRTWVEARRENVTVQKQFTGVMLIGVKLDKP